MTYRIHVAALSKALGSDDYMRVVVLRFLVEARSIERAIGRVHLWCDDHDLLLCKTQDVYTSVTRRYAVDLRADALADTIPPSEAA